MTSIAVLVSNDLNQDQRMHRICTILHRKYGDVTLVGRKKRNSEALQKRTYDCVRLKLTAEDGPAFYYALMRHQLKWLMKRNPDIVYAVDADTLMAAYIYKNRRKTTLIYDAHEYFTEVPELEGAILKKSIWRYVERQGVAAADLCITVNQSLAQVFATAYKKDFKVIRNVPFLEAELGSTPERRTILYQGVLNKGRGIEFLIQFCIAHAQYTLWLVGGGDLEADLKDLASGAENIIFWGWKYGDELKELTARAWVGVNLLEGSSLNYHYSLANKFFDYMHAGIPSINMDFPEYRKINEIHEVSVLIDDLNNEALLSALEHLEDQSTYDRLTTNALQARTEFNWDREGEKLMNLLP